MNKHSTELREIRTINGLRGHPYVLLAQYTDSQGQAHFFQSRCLYRKLNDSIVEKAVKVYIQGGNYTCCGQTFNSVFIHFYHSIVLFFVRILRTDSRYINLLNQRLLPIF